MNAARPYAWSAASRRTRRRLSCHNGKAARAIMLREKGTLDTWALDAWKESAMTEGCSSPQVQEHEEKHPESALDACRVTARTIEDGAEHHGHHKRRADVDHQRQRVAVELTHCIARAWVKVLCPSAVFKRPTVNGQRRLPLTRPRHQLLELNTDRRVPKFWGRRRVQSGPGVDGPDCQAAAQNRRR